MELQSSDDEDHLVLYAESRLTSRLQKAGHSVLHTLRTTNGAMDDHVTVMPDWSTISVLIPELKTFWWLSQMPWKSTNSSTQHCGPGALQDRWNLMTLLYADGVDRPIDERCHSEPQRFLHHQANQSNQDQAGVYCNRLLAT